MITKKKLERVLCATFNFNPRRVSVSWLDAIDCDPDPKNPDHWQELLYSEKHNVYINLANFPKLTIEATHNTDVLGKYKIDDTTTMNEVAKYVSSIISE